MPIPLYLFAAILLLAGVYHFVNPTFYFPFMPDWLPKPLANTAGGVAEIIIGLLMLIPGTRKFGIIAATALMLLFLPLHVIDLLRERPVIGSKAIAVFRLFLQLLLIVWLVWAGSRAKG